MHKGLKEPHLFNASSNPLKLIRNLMHVFTAEELDKIRREIDTNVVGLFGLGESHYNFACTVERAQWRQRVSRLYYGAYNIRRAVALKYSGTFSTDSSDHQKVDGIPAEINNAEVYRNRLLSLRDDRNLADYSHLAMETDLLIPADECQLLVHDFLNDARVYLQKQGVEL